MSKELIAEIKAETVRCACAQLRECAYDASALPKTHEIFVASPSLLNPVVE
jgi:hypothetical protein